MRRAATRWLAFLALTQVAPAFADDRDPAEVPQTLFEQGRALLVEHHAAEACTKFEAALAQEPDAAGVMLNLGLCNAELDRAATALVWFRKAQTRGYEAQHPEIESEAKAQAAALVVTVPTLQLSFATRPAEPAVVTLDGAKLAEIDYAHVEVNAGHHVIEVTTARGVTTRAVDVVDGDHAAVALVPFAPKLRTIVVDTGAAQRRHGYLFTGIGGGVLALTLAGGLVAHHVASDPHTQIDAEVTLHNTFRYAITPLAIGAMAATAYGVYLYRTAPGRQRREEIVPDVGPQHVGLVLTRAF